MSAALEHIEDLGDFVTGSPSSFHAAAATAERLTAAGFTRLDEGESWQLEPGAGYLIVRDGSVLAWRIPAGFHPGAGFKIIGAHTDSPGFKLKPRPDAGRDGWQQIGVEVYGGPLLNSWLDRELGLAGRLVLLDRSSGMVWEQLVATDAMMRIPQLAVHLDRGVNDQGLKLDRQQHTMPIWGVGRPDRTVLDHLAERVGVSREQVLGYDVVAYDTCAPSVFGADREFFASGRLDNLSSVHAGLVALQQADLGGSVQVLAAFDHEEVGSATRSGAEGPMLADVLSRISSALGHDQQDHLRTLSASYCLSADAGHAVHPNYPGHHDPQNRPLLNSGPLLKINANQRYATDAVGTGLWRLMCSAAGVRTQEFVSENAIPCGSTIGPITATRLGITTIDVGVPLLSMHSARELAGVEDPYALSRAMQAFLTGAA